MQNDLDENLLSRASGPGAYEDSEIAPEPTLQGASEEEYVTILNPLSVPFVGQVGQERPVHMPFKVHRDGVIPVQTMSEGDVARNYGLNLKNPDHNAKSKIVNRVVIKPGQTVTLLGNEAQVIVRQLVNEIMQREGKRLMLADPYQRSLVEERIIMSRGLLAEKLGQQPVTVKEQLRSAVDELNRESEEEFPDARGVGTSATVDQQPAEAPQARTDSTSRAIEAAKRRSSIKTQESTANN